MHQGVKPLAVTRHCRVSTICPPTGNVGITTPVVPVRLATGTVAPGQLAPPDAVQAAVGAGSMQSSPAPGVSRITVPLAALGPGLLVVTV